MRVRPLRCVRMRGETCGLATWHVRSRGDAFEVSSKPKSLLQGQGCPPWGGSRVFRGAKKKSAYTLPIPVNTLQGTGRRPWETIARSPGMCVCLLAP